MVNEGEVDGEKASADLIQERYAGRIERLAALNEVRLQESSARKSSMAASVDPRESVDLFLSTFSEKRKVVEIGLALARTKEIEPDGLKGHLENMSMEVAAMEKTIANSAYFLPGSVVKASQITVVKLRDELQIADQQLIPKKRFAFRNKGQVSNVAMPSSAGKNGEQITSVAMNRSGNDPAIRGQDSSSKRVVQDSPSSCLVKSIGARRIEGESNAVIVRNAQELGGELILSNLSDCQVYLKGQLTTLVIHSVKRCNIFAGPVTGSVFIEHVECSILVLASHQIRIHSTHFTDFYLRVRSRPIVEYTSKNRFAPYAFNYEGIEEHLRAAQLAEETGLWERVDDFRWLRAVHSPNWSILPVDQRIPTEPGPT